MKIKTIIKGIRGALSLAILSGIAYTMIIDSLSSKGGIKSIRNFKMKDNKEADHIMN